jgi:hypothetical protein
MHKGACALSTFDGFPYLATRIVPALIHIIALPRDLTTNNLLELARWQVGANQLDTCLVLSGRSAIYLDADGTESRAADIPTGVLLGQRLQACCDFPKTPDLAARAKALHELQESQPRGGCMMGDLTKGGRPATPEEQRRLAGKQPNGAPVGLVQCDVCGLFRGQCLDPNPVFRGRLMTVCCRCQNRNLCARCGRPLHEFKLNANCYENGGIWHVPGFSGLSHKCPA